KLPRAAARDQAVYPGLDRALDEVAEARLVDAAAIGRKGRAQSGQNTTEIARHHQPPLSFVCRMYGPCLPHPPRGAPSCAAARVDASANTARLNLSAPPGSASHKFGDRGVRVSPPHAGRRLYLPA